jgi:hypothetical protein
VLWRPTAATDGVDELQDGGGDASGRLDELDARTINDQLLIDVADTAMGDPALDHHGPVAKRESEIVQGIELEGKDSFNLGAAVADLLDGDGLKDHHLAVQLAEDLNPFGIPLFSVGCHGSDEGPTIPSIHPHRRLPREHLTLCWF